MRYQQEVDLLTLYKDVANDYVQMVTVPEQLPNVLDRAIRIATAKRTVTAVIIPSDVQELEYTPPPHAFKMVPSSLDQTFAAPVPAQEDLRRAAEVINSGNKLAVLVGQGARSAVAEVTDLSELRGAGVAKALLGKDVLSDEEPWVTGSIGLLGTRPSYELMMDCDTLLVVGSNFPYTQFLPPFEDGEPSVRAVQIDVDPTMLGLRYPFEVNLVGDASTTLQALLPMLEPLEDRGWRETVEANVRRWWEVMDARGKVSADPVNPEQVFSVLSPLLPENVMISADSGSGTNWYARHVKMRGTMRGTLSGTLATMGCGVPYAIGAKFAHPDRPALACAGDGAMQMNGLAELITISKYWKDWSDPRLVVCVLENDDLNQVTWELRAMGGSPEFLPSQHLPSVDYAAFARSLGLHGIRVDDPDQVGPAWQDALAQQRPCVIVFRTDPAVPPIPPHATWDQITSAAESVVRGDADRLDVIKEGVKSKLAEAFPEHPQ